MFSFSSVMPTEQLVNERVQDGVVHWNIIEFAEMPKFQSNLMNQDNGAAWPIMDGATNTAVLDAIRWLKNQPQWFQNQVLLKPNRVSPISFKILSKLL